MGKADVNVNIWLSEKNRFANLFNGVIYGGENVILPEAVSYTHLDVYKRQE